MAQDEPDDEPRRFSPLFWICLLVLLEALVWTALTAVVSEAVATVLALAAGAAFVFVLKDRIWGPDWRERLAAARQHPPNRHH